MYNLLVGIGMHMVGPPSRESVRVVVVGLLAMTAVAAGAAAISAGVDAVPSSDDRGTDGGEPIADGALSSDEPERPEQHENPGPPVDPGPPRDPIEPKTCIQPLASWYGTAVYFGAFVALVGWTKRRYSLGASFFGLYAFAPPTFVTYFLATDCPVTGGPGIGDGPTPSGPSGPEFTDPLVTLVDVPPEAVLGALGVVLVGIAAVLLRASGDQSVAAVDRTASASDDGDPITPRDIGLAAGRAADRLEGQDAAVDNEVYRAWWELTGLCSVPDPDTATPREFADAAVAVGLDEAEVGELTRLFEDVRYGEADADRREERAISAFRSLEAAYAGDDSGVDPSPGGEQPNSKR